MVEVSLDNRGRVHVERMVFAIDCGIAVSPDLVRAQVEGGILFGLSAAVWGEITLGESGDIVTQNFDRYQVARMRTKPAIDAHLIESTEPLGGVGEVSTPSVAPALANAFTSHLDEAPLTTEDAAAINRGNALALFPRLAT